MARIATLLIGVFFAAACLSASAHFAEIDEAMEAEVSAYSTYDLEAELDTASFLDESADADEEADMDAEVDEEGSDDLAEEFESPAFVEVDAEARATQAMLMEAEASTKLDTKNIPSRLADLPAGDSDVYNNFLEHNLAVHNTVKYRTATGARPKNAVMLRLHQTFALQVPKQYAEAGSSYRLVDQIGQAIPLTVYSATNGRLMLANKHSIGRFFLEIIKGTTIVYRAQDLFYFVFNPMHPDDPTFVSDQDKTKYGSNSGSNVNLDEHLFSEFGGIYQGSSSAPPSWIPWAFNQFDMTVLDVAMGFMMRMTPTQRADPVLVSRFITAFVPNVLYGRWGGDYSGGSAPWVWVSSLPIIQRFVASSNQEPTRYGQCWVFAALTTTFSRSIGMPSAVITNLDSAHKYIHRAGVPQDHTCNALFAEVSQGRFVSQPSDHSLWNFHVFNINWFRRKDVADSDGWQSIDATKQEPSKEGPNEAPFTNYQFMNGPASLDSLRRMDFKANYDSVFQSSMTNCAKVTKLRRMNSNSYVVTGETDTVTVGKYMLTKMPDNLCNKNTRGQNGYTSICHHNVARAYSNVGTFLETGARNTSLAESSAASHTSSYMRFATAPEALAYAEANTDATVVLPTLPVKSGIRPVRSDPMDMDPARFGDVLSFFAEYDGTSAGKLRYTITIAAVTPRNDPEDPHTVLRTINGTVEANVEDPKMELLWDRDMWVSPDVAAAFRWTNNFRVTYEVEQIDGANRGATHFHHTSLLITQPHIDIDCGGKSEYVIGDTLTCNIGVTDPQGVLKLSNVRVAIEVAGQNADSRPMAAAFTAPVVERGTDGSSTYSFGGITAPLTTASSRWVGALVRIIADEIPTITATELILVRPSAEAAEAAAATGVAEGKEKPGFFADLRKVFRSFKSRPAVNNAQTAPQLFLF